MTVPDNALKNSVLWTVCQIMLIVALIVMMGVFVVWLLKGGPQLDAALLSTLLPMGGMAWALLSAIATVLWFVMQQMIGRLVMAKAAPALTPEAQPAPQIPWPDALRERLSAQHGLLWRFRVRLLLVVGEPEQIEAIAPGLARQHWLHLDMHPDNVILIWGGPVQARLNADCYRDISGWRPLDGVVWALDVAQSTDANAMNAGVRHLQRLTRDLHWALPLYLWQVTYNPTTKKDYPLQAIGCARRSPGTLEVFMAALGGLLEPLLKQGLEHLRSDHRHCFMLQLSHDLKTEGLARWHKALAPLFGPFGRGLLLRGLWFSPALPAVHAGLEHQGAISPAWQGVTEDRPGPLRRVGWPLPRLARITLLALALCGLAGLLLSFNANRTHIARVQTALAGLQVEGHGNPQFLALHALMSELDTLAGGDAPWPERLGLSQHQALLDTGLPRYAEASQRLLHAPAQAAIEQALREWLALPVQGHERTEQATQAYDQLKAYLMLARPERVDPVLMVRTLGALELAQDAVSPGIWQTLAPDLWRFQATQLTRQPGIEVDARLVAEVRQVLLKQLGQRTAQDSLYRQVLEAALNHYPALGLHDLTGETDAQALFSLSEPVPGVFTRQAWEGQVRQAIAEITQARREEIDWVLSDSPADIAAELSPEALAAQLTERYFQDYAKAWLKVLGSLRWQPVQSLEGVIDQLSLVSDPRQSPLLALATTLVWQGEAGSHQPALGDTLIQSAQQLIGRENTRVTPQPLDATFGPWRALLGKDPELRTADSERLSLHAWLTRVIRVRLKLQQISQASDPQGMTQALAQTVFQGRSVDLTDTRNYGGLIAASLGAQWGGVGQTLFVEPLEQAWQRVLQPSAASLNSQWQRAIVTPWEQAFNGRYPFAATGSDASLALLGQMVRADTGQIEQFLQRELSGVLRKEGNRWVVDRTHGQGLRINPQFLAAVNQLSHLSDVLFTDGGLGMGFELNAKPVRDLVQTTFVLNGAKHEYFNQRERWQRFTWPGTSDYPGVTLRWIGLHSGERLFADHQGTWGLIRLLEQAQITVLDPSDSRYQVVIKAPDNLPLTWHLRTELGAGPMTLLRLRGFKLPRQIFLAQGLKSEQAEQAGRSE